MSPKVKNIVFPIAIAVCFAIYVMIFGKAPLWAALFPVVLMTTVAYNLWKGNSFEKMLLYGLLTAGIYVGGMVLLVLLTGKSEFAMNVMLFPFHNYY